MKQKLIAVLSWELLAAILISLLGVLHDRDSARAWLAWHQAPTVENRMELDRQRKVDLLYRGGIAVIAFAVMAGVTLGLPWMRERGEAPG